MSPRDSVLPQDIVTLFPGVVEGIEVKRIVDVVLFHLGLPIGGAVDLAVSAMGDKGVLLYRVEIICRRKGKVRSGAGLLRGVQSKNILLIAS